MTNGRIMMGISVFCLIFVTLGGTGIVTGNLTGRSKEDMITGKSIDPRNLFQRSSISSNDFDAISEKNDQVHSELSNEEPSGNIEKLWDIGAGSNYWGVKTLDSSYFGYPLLFFINYEGFVHAMKFTGEKLEPLWRSQDLGSWLIDLEIGDVDGDDAPEIVVSDHHVIYVMEFDLKDCNIIWMSQEFGSSHKHRITDLSLGDTNGDGLSEICFTMYNSFSDGSYEGASSIFLSNINVLAYRNGNWEREWSAAPRSKINEGYACIATGNIFKGKGNEIIVGGQYGLEIYSFKIGIYQRVWASSSSGDRVDSISIGDIDGDLKNDVVAVCDYRKILIYQNFNENVIIPLYEEEYGSSGRSAILDLTGDGQNEIIVGGKWEIHIFFYNYGSISKITETGLVGWAWLVECSDFFPKVNEFLIYDRYYSDFHIMTLEENKIKTLWQSDLVGSVEQMEIGDFSGDGQMKVVIIDHRERVFIFSTEGLRLGKIVLEYSYGPTIISSGDYDSDDKDELALAFGPKTYGGKEYAIVQIFGYNNGEFHLENEVHIYSEFEPACMVSGDIDGDGISDIVLATKGKWKHYDLDVIIDDGDLFVIKPHGYEFTRIYGYAEGLAVADTDSDGKMEIIHKGYKTYITPSVGGWQEVYRNRILVIERSYGDYNVEYKIENYPENSPNRYGLCVGDFKSGGRADILSQNSDSWSDLYQFNGSGYEEIDGDSLDGMGFATVFDIGSNGVRDTITSNKSGVYLFDFSLGYDTDGIKLGELVGGSIKCLVEKQIDLMLHLNDDGYLSEYRFV